MLKSTRKYYDMAMSIFIGNQIIKKLEALKESKSIETLREGLVTSNNTTDKWIDLAGMIAPEQEVEALIKDISCGNLKSLDEISSGLKRIHDSYESYVWDWTTRILSERYDIDVSNIEAGQLLELLSKWEKESIKLDKMILNDASKEYDDSSKLGFGVDGDQSVVDKDFEAVRGTPEENKFIAGINQEMMQIEEKGAELRNILEKI